MENIFENYVNDIYNLKVNSKGGEREIFKLLLNGLYGYIGRKKYLRVSQVLSLKKANEL